MNSHLSIPQLQYLPTPNQSYFIYILTMPLSSLGSFEANLQYNNHFINKYFSMYLKDKDSSLKT